MEELYVVAATLVVVLIILITYNRITEVDHLKGFWCADSEFCKQSELEMFILYLGDCETTIGNKRNGYLLAANEHGIILNNPMKMSFSRSLSSMLDGPQCTTLDVQTSWEGEPPADVNAFPKKCKVCYWPKHGKLVFYENDQIVAVLWKDNCMSSVLYKDVLMPKNISTVQNSTGEYI